MFERIWRTLLRSEERDIISHIDQPPVVGDSHAFYGGGTYDGIKNSGAGAKSLACILKSIDLISYKLSCAFN